MNTAEADIQEKDITKCEKLDKTLKQLISNAAKMMEECRRVAKIDAESIINEANIRAQKSVKEAQEELTKIQEEVNRLKDIRNHFNKEMKNIIARNAAKLDLYFDPSLTKSTEA